MLRTQAVILVTLGILACGSSRDRGATDAAKPDVPIDQPAVDVQSDLRDAPKEAGGDRPFDVPPDLPGDPKIAPDLPPPTPAEKSCAELYGALIRRLAVCDLSSERLWTQFADARHNCRLLGKGVAAGRMVFDETQVAGCLTALGALSCDDLWYEILYPDACRAAFRGVLEEGKTCYQTTFSLLGECDAGLYCSGGGASCPGMCTRFAVADEGCIDDSNCARGTSCNFISKTCAATAAMGGSCGGPTLGDCQPGLYCDGATDLLPGTCLDQKTGGPCALSVTCALGHECLAGTCVRRKVPGDPCMPGECGNFAGVCLAGKCEDYPDVGGACGEIGSELVPCGVGYCDAGAATSGTCKPFKEDGESCTLLDECGYAGQCHMFLMECSPFCQAP